METVETVIWCLVHYVDAGQKTYPVNAIAVNPEMQDAGIMDNVRNRTWTRAALQAGVGFVQAAGAAKRKKKLLSNVPKRGMVIKHHA